MPRPLRLTRREFVRTGTAIAAAAVLEGPAIHIARRGAGAGPSFQRALPIPPVLAPVRRDATTAYYEIVQRAGRGMLLPGMPTTVWGYDGRWPGPTIRARRGRTVVVRHTNALPVPTVVHLHGAEQDASRTRDVVFAGGPRGFPPQAHWTIDGRDFDAARPIATPRSGDVEIWRLANHRRFGVLGMLHTVHIHLVRFLILDRNGRAPEPWERGWKDTVALYQGDVVRVVMRFGGHKGRYLVHCHNLEHEDASMMARYDVV